MPLVAGGTVDEDVDVAAVLVAGVVPVEVVPVEVRVGLVVVWTTDVVVEGGTWESPLQPTSAAASRRAIKVPRG
ncbi:hypothetical protein [Smaragdicoccus niigatensis]|uniref:hypothetical protein n=1 Tax=Smaragdicoccus niigatensis TaxID=359359 RepID=UPI0003A7D0D5|nr:hypothetical protein [Smaragdicoccus niigatensis]